MRMRWIWVVVCVAALAAVASAAPPPPSPPNPEIVYLEAGTRDKIVVMNSDGSNKTVVYSGAAGQILSKPRFSPDAQWIAFTGAGVGLYRVERATGVATLLLTNAQCGQSCWSPRFSPSGTRIAVANTDSNAPKILSVPSTGGATQVLYAGSPGTTFWDVAWSSDETRIAVIENVASPSPDRIVVVDLGTGTPSTIVNGPFVHIITLDWARNNVDRIVFSGGADTTALSIYRIDFGASPIFVTSGAHPSFSPNNASIVYVRQPSRMRQIIATLNLGTGASTDLAVGNQPDWKR